MVGALAAAVAVLTCFAFSKDLVVFLEAPVASQGVRFLQLSPGEFFFTTLKVRCRVAFSEPVSPALDMHEHAAYWAAAACSLHLEQHSTACMA